MTTMSAAELKNKIIIANREYRRGGVEDIILDADYDYLLEELSKLIDSSEYNSFVDMLHEDRGEYAHPYIMGSLNKLKAEEPEAVFSFLKNNIVSGLLHISAKIDGISCRLQYDKNGKLVAGFTRGDGKTGQKITSKVKNVKLIPHTIENTTGTDINIRGELVIFKKDFAKISAQFKNPRNACAGIINQNFPDKALLEECVSFIAYEIMGGQMTKHEQFIKLSKLGFKTAYWLEYAANFNKLTNYNLQKLIEITEYDYEYETDGLVLSDKNYIAENVFRPIAQVAFKVNNLKAISTIIDIDWRGPSKDGKYVPVAKINPIDINGSTISYVTCHNLDYLKKNNIVIGATVEVTKSGDVIPRITKVLDLPVENDTVLSNQPNKCKICNTELIVDGCDLRCTNRTCNAKELEAVANFIRKIGIKDAAKQSLINWQITAFEELLNFRPNNDSISEKKFFQRLCTKLFTLSPADILKQLNFKGLAEKSIEKIIVFYGLENAMNKKFAGGYPPGIGQLTIDAFCEYIDDNKIIVDMILADSRYSCDVESANSAQMKNDNLPIKGTVCFTGTLTNMSRTEAENNAKSMGWVISGVNKNLDVLVCNDPNSTSSKMKKARQLGTVKIVNEFDFFNNFCV